MGKEALIDFLNKRTLAQLLERGKSYAKRSSDTSFRIFSDIFKNPWMESTLVMEIVEDTDTVFEVKVTECLVADTFLRAEAGEIGNAAVCIDVRDPSHPVRIGSFYDGGRPNGFQVAGNLIYMADGSDGLEIIRFRKE